MPGGDGTGPMGLGPMTGRAAGYCAGHPVPGYMNPIPGRSWYRGGDWRARQWYGRWRGSRSLYYAADFPGWAGEPYVMPSYGGRVYPGEWSPSMWGPFYQEPTPEEELEMLKRDQGYLKTQLEEIESRIETLKKVEEPEKKK